MRVYIVFLELFDVWFVRFFKSKLCTIFVLLYEQKWIVNVSLPALSFKYWTELRRVYIATCERLMVYLVGLLMYRKFSPVCAT